MKYLFILMWFIGEMFAQCVDIKYFDAKSLSEVIDRFNDRSNGKNLEFQNGMICSKEFRSCKDIKSSKPNAKSGVYTIKPFDKSIDVYCEMDIDGGGWTQYAYINHPSDNFNNSVNIGVFDYGVCDNNSICSINVEKLYKNNSNSFDLMIQYGDKMVHSEVLRGFVKHNNNYFINPSKQCCKVGEHGMIGKNHVNKYYATFCATTGGCLSQGKDFMNFSLNGVFPDSFANVKCGFYGWNGVNWKMCENSDNKQVMRYFIRE